MKKFPTKEHLQNYRRYHLPGCSSVKSVKTNIIYLNRHNRKIHELKKLDLAWDAQLYLTEAARKATEEEKKMFDVMKEMVIDFVDLISQREYQIIYKHESDEQIKFYRDHGTIPIIINGMFCYLCGLEYPERNKRHICQICAKAQREKNDA